MLSMCNFICDILTKSNQIMHKAFIDGQQIPMYNLYDLPQFFRGKLQIKKS